MVDETIFCTIWEERAYSGGEPGVVPNVVGGEPDKHEPRSRFHVAPGGVVASVPLGQREAAVGVAVPDLQAVAVGAVFLAVELRSEKQWKCKSRLNFARHVIEILLIYR